MKGLSKIMIDSKKTKEKCNITGKNIDLKMVESAVKETERESLGVKYAKKDLNKMFVCIFGEKPLSKMKKEDIAYCLWNHFHHVDRARAILGS